MGLKVRWAESALAGLEQVLAFIAEDNPEAARRLWKEAKAATRGLRRYPMRGRMVPEYQEPTIREVLVGPMRIIYTTADPAVVHILAAIRAERQLPGSDLDVD